MTPTQNYFIILASAAVMSLLITFFVVHKFKITNAIFALVRAIATFTAIWLIWGNIARHAIDNVNYQQVGLFQYLTLQYIPNADQHWTISAELELVALVLSLVATLAATVGLSFILSRLAAISDRQR